MGRNDDDLELVHRCIAREPGAWRDFVDRFAATARIVARRYLKLHGRAHEDVDDTVQDVFVAITRRDFRLLKNYDPRYTFKTYLGVITRTEVYRQLRKKRPIPGDPADLDRNVAWSYTMNNMTGDEGCNERVARLMQALAPCIA